jgi:hypothetical protein
MHAGRLPVLIASIEGTFMCNHPEEGGVTTSFDRTSADAYGIVAILKAVFQSILVPAEIIKDSLPDEWYYSWKVAPTLLSVSSSIPLIQF